MTPLSKQLLETIPASWDEAQSWIESTLLKIKRLDAITETASLEWSDICQDPHSPFGLYASEHWRKFALAAFAADLACYPQAKDQVNFDRLLFVMHNFPQGFRTWWVKTNNSSWLPVGYTGWYPMLESAFETFKTSPEKLTSRMVVPVAESPYLYLFNFSVAPQLKGTPLTKALVTTYANDIHRQNAKGLACITVSDDGKRIASRFGMSCTGHISQENVYVTAHPSQMPEHPIT